MNSEELKFKVAEMLGDAYTVEARKVLKVNVTLDSLIITKKGDNVGITLQIDDGMTADKVIDIIKNVKYDMPEINADSFSDIENRVILQAINLEKNQEYLLDKPHRIIAGDLAVILRVMISEDSDGLKSVVVTDSMVDTFSLNKTALFTAAEKNTASRVVIKPLMEFISEAMDTDINIDDMPLDMTVVSNDISMYGAGVLGCPEVLDKIGENKLIIPSSIHELIIVPKDDIFTTNLAEIITDVNKTALNPEEILSNHAYTYDSVNKVVSAA